MAAVEEIDFIASLCDYPPGVLIALTRSHENGAIREEFRTLRPREGAAYTRAFQFLEVVDKDPAPNKHFELAMQAKEPRR